MDLRGLSQTLSNLVIAQGAEETVRAWQWSSSILRVNHSKFHIQAGFAFEQMAKDAHNIRHPFHQIKLMAASNHPGVDAVGKDLRIQYKASTSKHYQIKGVEGLGPEGGQVVVPKGAKTYNHPSVIESPVSMEDIRRASKATAKAASTAKLVAKGARDGAIVAGGMETVIQGYKAATKTGSRSHKGWEGQLKHAVKQVAKEATIGGISGAAATLWSVKATKAALPAIAVVGGGVVAGAGAAYGALQAGKAINKLVRKIW